MLRKFFAIVTTLALLAILVTGCGGQGSAQSSSGESGGAAAQGGEPSGGTVLIGLSIRGLDNPYYVELVESVQKVSAELGGTEVVVMEHHSDEQKQVNDIKAFAARGGKDCVLYTDPQSATINAEIAEICESAGIYWTSCWTMADGVYPWDYQYYVSHQTMDDVTAGYSVAVAMFESFDTPGQGTVLNLEGSLANDASNNRTRGLHKALEEYPGVELLDAQPTDMDPQKGLNVVQTWLTQYEQVDGIFCMNDALSLAAVEALRVKGLNGQVKVSGIDGIPDAITAIRNGDMAATYYSNPWDQGAYGVLTVLAAYYGELDVESLPKEQRAYYTAGVLVTTEGADEYVANYVETHPPINYDDCFASAVKGIEGDW